MTGIKINNDSFEYCQIDDIAVITLQKGAKKISSTLDLRKEMISVLNSIKESEEIKGLVVLYSDQYNDNLEYRQYIYENLEKREYTTSSQYTDTYKSSLIEFLKMIYKFPKPIVAGMNGHIGPDSFGLSLAFDLRIATGNTIFYNPNLQIGFPPSAPLSFYLIRSLGYHKATELLLTKTEFSSQEAFELGLITQIVSEKELEDRCIKKLKELRDIPAHALVETRRLLQPDMDDIRKHIDKGFEGSLRCLYKMKS